MIALNRLSLMQIELKDKMNGIMKFAIFSEIYMVFIFKIYKVKKKEKVE